MARLRLKRPIRTTSNITFLALGAVWLTISLPQHVQAQHGSPPDTTEHNKPDPNDGDEQESAIQARYNDGLELLTTDGNWRLHLESRFQFRYSHPFDANPTDPEDIVGAVGSDDVSSLRIQRARLRMGGHAYRPWIGYYIEYDWPNSRLLDFRMTLSKFSALQLRVGQWKPEYNRERRASSREQQFVDRSLANYFFTIDRQQGMMVLGRLAGGSAADSRYFIGMFSGNGARTGNDNTDFMWMGRYQWNFLGRDLEYAQSDLDFREKPAASVAIAGVTNISRCTRFSSSGCGQLPGFEDGDPGQYLVQQLLGEFALKHRGFSTQLEYHLKRIEDRSAESETKLNGGYFQVGYFPHAAIGSFPKPLELALRYAVVDPNREVEGDVMREYSMGVNWFFAGHRNKLAADVSLFTAEGDAGSRGRVRIQWEVSF